MKARSKKARKICYLPSRHDQWEYLVDFRIKYKVDMVAQAKKLITYW